MSGCRTAFGVGSFALALAIAVGCGGSVVRHDGDEPEPQPGTGGSSPGGSGSGVAGSRAGSAGKQSTAGSSGSSGSASGGSGAVEPDPVDTGCPVEELPPPVLECDPFVPGDCGSGAGCYPYVEHPEGSGCDQQRYGTTCGPAGTGTQGALCGGALGDDWCAPGFVCVVGQRAGKRCAALCQLGSTNQCTGGLVCGELDVAGFGVCG